MDKQLTVDQITNKIYFIKGVKVILDRDLAELYGVETKVLKQAVKRKIERFPKDFMFELSKEELKNWRSQFVTSNGVITEDRFRIVFETLDHMLVTESKPKKKIGFTIKEKQRTYEPISKCFSLVKLKAGENFNRRNTWSISRLEI